MTNFSQTKNSNIAVALTVASGVEAGDIAVLGSAGFFGIALTDRYESSDYGPDVITTPPQGLSDGQASVELPGVATVVNLTADSTTGFTTAFAKAYWDATNKVITATATSNTLIGYVLEAIVKGTVGRVALVQGA